jgi:PAS domain S-box-containing protein
MDSADVLAQITYFGMLPFLIGVMTAAAVIGILVVERRRGINERTIRENERTINVLLNAVPDDLALINSEKKIITINKSLAEKLGTSREAVAGRAIGNCITSTALGDTLDRIHDPAMTVNQVYFDEKWNDRWLETSVHPVTDTDGTGISIAIQSHDITLRKNFEEEMKNAVLSQIEKNIEKFQVLNDKIRNPLQVIKGYLAIIDTEYYDRINKQIEIIDNIVTQLDMGWLESEKVQQFLLKHSHYASQPSTGHFPKEGLQ